jgi:uncharacterized GH25 family protein
MRTYIQCLLLFSISVLFLSPSAAHAHDGWIEISPSIVEKGQPVTIALMQGNHSNEHRSYRLAGKWDLDFTKIMVISPLGKVNDITGAALDFGEDSEKTGPKGPKGFHLAQLIADEEGVYTVVAKQERTVQREDGAKFRGVRFARSSFAALALPTVAEAQKLKRFDLQNKSEDVLEIVPLANPLSATPQSTVMLEVRHKGKPAPGKVVSVLRKIAGAGSAQDLTTDEQGRVSVAVGPADSYLARVKFEERTERGEGKFNLNSYEATYVFPVFNRR